jgi:hypothetical protein
MTVNHALAYLAFWSLIGAALFSIFVVFAFRSGAVYLARKRDGTLKEKVPLSGILIMAGFLAAVILFFVAANFFGVASKHFSVGFWTLFTLNYALYLNLFAFDTLIIDGFLLSYWRPDFLRLSNELNKESMKEHIIKSLPIGTGLGLVFAGLTTTIAYYSFMT